MMDARVFLRIAFFFGISVQMLTMATYFHHHSLLLDCIYDIFDSVKIIIIIIIKKNKIK